MLSSSYKQRHQALLTCYNSLVDLSISRLVTNLTCCRAHDILCHMEKSLQLFNSNRLFYGTVYNKGEAADMAYC